MALPKGIRIEWRDLRLEWKQAVLMLVSLIGIINFAVGWSFVGQWIIRASAECVRWHYIRFSLPYLGLTLLFIAALVLGAQKWYRTSLAIWALAVVLSASLFAYDIVHERAQLRTPPYYVFWWWYNPYHPPEGATIL